MHFHLHFPFLCEALLLFIFAAYSCTASPQTAIVMGLMKDLPIPGIGGLLPPETPLNQPNPTNPAPATASNLVFAHHIVGNTYNYTVSTWASDIALAASKGIDAFALNVGGDAWEVDQVAHAYAAAMAIHSPLKLFISLDMTSIPCSTAADISAVQSYITKYAAHPNQLLYDEKVFLSTFAGQTCTFGQGGANAGWIRAVRTNVPPVYFMPSFFVNPSMFSTSTFSVMDGAFNWNSGWPMGNYDINFDPDNAYLSNLGSKSYMAAVSPWFFTHYGINSYNKNFIYRSDDWLFAQRWELLVQNRARVPFAEVVSWNDFGESHYIGPIEGVQPMSQSWVNGYDHQGWLDLMHYYIMAFKTGSYPTITKDRVFLWGRRYPANASSPDPVPRPTNYQWAQDYVWGVVLLNAPASVTMSCGATTQTTAAPAGLTKLKLPLEQDCTVQTTIIRNGAMAMSFAPSGFAFSTNPPTYNFNAFVSASPP